jgi:hypothetical protein
LILGVVIFMNVIPEKTQTPPPYTRDGIGWLERERSVTKRERKRERKREQLLTCYIHTIAERI